MTKDDVLSLLSENSLSGQEIAKKLGVSRAAVWKAVEQLRREGYRIESATNRGYRLAPDSDGLSAAGIERYLRHRELRVRTEECVPSTNTLVKELAAAGEAEGFALVAGRQTAGRGRRGRSFYSPADTGLYLSLLLRPRMSAEQSAGLTAMAAVAVAEAVERLSGRKAQIKWVNDVLLDGKKICGILTEAGVDWESGEVDYAVVGVGINLRTPEGGFPRELPEAGAAFDGCAVPDLRCRLAAAVLDGLMDGRERPGECLEAYRARCIVPGREIAVLRPGQEPLRALALEVDEGFALRVRYEDGSEGRLQAGEVSIRTGKETD